MKNNSVSDPFSRSPSLPASLDNSPSLSGEHVKAQEMAAETRRLSLRSTLLTAIEEYGLRDYENLWRILTDRTSNTAVRALIMEGLSIKAITQEDLPDVRVIIGSYAAHSEDIWAQFQTVADQIALAFGIWSENALPSFIELARLFYESEKTFHNLGDFLSEFAGSLETDAAFVRLHRLQRDTDKEMQYSSRTETRRARKYSSHHVTRSGNMIPGRRRGRN
jgi:hypothetical protein